MGRYDEASEGALQLYADFDPWDLAEMLIQVRTRLSQIETRAQQVRGGLKPYARPVEIVDFLMGEQP